MRKCVNEIKLPVEEYAKYANQANVFPDTTPKTARALDAAPVQPVAPQVAPQVTVIPANQGYPMLSQSMHSYHGGGMLFREQAQVPASYTSSLLGNSYSGGQVGVGHNGAQVFNGYSLSSSMGGVEASMMRDNGHMLLRE